MSEYKFKMPKLGESITEAAIMKWFKNVGETIEEDEVLLEVATDKVDSDVPSPVSGTITEIRFQKNAVVGVGEILALINSDEKIAGKKITIGKTETKSMPAETKKADITGDEAKQKYINLVQKYLK